MRIPASVCVGYFVFDISIWWKFQDDELAANPALTWQFSVIDRGGVCVLLLRQDTTGREGDKVKVI